MRHSAVSHAGLGSFLLGPTPSCFIAIHQLRAIWSDGHKFTWNTKLLILIAYIVSRHGALSILRDRDVQIQNNLQAIQLMQTPNTPANSKYSLVQVTILLPLSSAVPVAHHLRKHHILRYSASRHR